jgi:metal-sulfur cluster biosynthetic enzyme
MPKVIWEADSTHPEEAESIREALREIVDPEIGLNVIELGMIRDVSFNNPDVHIRMILTTPFCPYGPVLLESVRAKIEQVIGMPTTIELGMEMWDSSMLEDDVGSDWGLF